MRSRKEIWESKARQDYSGNGGMGYHQAELIIELLLDIREQLGSSGWFHDPERKEKVK